jgi:hypothetical protein
LYLATLNGTNGRRWRSRQWRPMANGVPLFRHQKHVKIIQTIDTEDQA